MKKNQNIHVLMKKIFGRVEIGLEDNWKENIDNWFPFGEVQRRIPSYIKLSRSFELKSQSFEQFCGSFPYNAEDLKDVRIFWGHYQVQPFIY